MKFPASSRIGLVNIFSPSLDLKYGINSAPKLESTPFKTRVPKVEP